MRKVVVVLTVALALCGCGGGGSGATQAPADPAANPVTPAAPAATSATIYGRVLDAATGGPVPGAAVQLGSSSVKTGPDGSFLVDAVPFGRALAVVASSPYVANKFPIAINAAQAAQRLELKLQPAATPQSFDPSTAQVLKSAGSAALVSLSAASLAGAAGTPPSGRVTAKLDAIAPALMPGDFTTGSGEQWQSYGAVSVEFSDANGAHLNLVAGKTALVQIPVLAPSGAALPASSPLYYLDESSGYWIREGSAVLAGTGASRYYEATVSHFSVWSAGDVFNTVTVRGRVLDADGNALGGVRVVCTGTNYLANASQAKTEYLSSSAGDFAVPMKSNATADCSASLNGVVSNLVGVTALTSDINLTQDLVLPITSVSKVILADTFVRVDTASYPLGGGAVEIHIPFETVGITLDWPAINNGQTHWEVTPVFGNSDGQSTFNFSMDGNSTYIGAARIDNATTPLQGVMSFGGYFTPSAADNRSNNVSITFLVRLTATQPNTRLGKLATISSELKRITISMARSPVVSKGLTWLPMLNEYLPYASASNYCAGKGYRLPSLAEAADFYPNGPFGVASGSQVGEVWTSSVASGLPAGYYYVVSGLPPSPGSTTPMYRQAQAGTVLTLCVK